MRLLLIRLLIFTACVSDAADMSNDGNLESNPFDTLEGAEVSKMFSETEYAGTVDGYYDAKGEEKTNNFACSDYVHVTYTDGDQEHMGMVDLQKHLVNQELKNTLHKLLKEKMKDDIFTCLIHTKMEKRFLWDGKPKMFEGIVTHYEKGQVKGGMRGRPTFPSPEDRVVVSYPFDGVTERISLNSLYHLIKEDGLVKEILEEINKSFDEERKQQRKRKKPQKKKEQQMREQLRAKPSILKPTPRTLRTETRNLFSLKDLSKETREILRSRPLNLEDLEAIKTLLAIKKK